jgi:hypothetical protein
MYKHKVYKLSMASGHVDSLLVIRDKTGAQLAFNYGGGGGKSAYLVFSPSSDDTYKVYAVSQKGFGGFALQIIEIDAKEDAKEKLAKRQANAALALLMLNKPSTVWPLLKQSPDSRVRSYLIHRFSPFGIDAKAIVKRLAEELDITIRRALILSLGEYGENDLSLDDRKALSAQLQDIHRTETDPGLHAASEWLLRTWKYESWLKQFNEELVKNKKERERRLKMINQLLTKEKKKAPPQWYLLTAAPPIARSCLSA